MTTSHFTSIRKPNQAMRPFWSIRDIVAGRPTTHVTAEIGDVVSHHFFAEGWEGGWDRKRPYGGYTVRP